MADLKDKTIVITGATSGIGAATAIALARQGARVLTVGRNRARGETVAQEIARGGGGTNEFLCADLLSFKDIARLADEIIRHAPSLDILINNAGGPFDKKTMSADGIEASFALNTVAPFALTNKLHSVLARAQGRVVNIVTGFWDNPRLNLDEVVNPQSFSKYREYSRAKLALVMVTLEQAERWQHDRISAVAVQPGVVPGTRFSGEERTAWVIFGEMMAKLLRVSATMERAVERFSRAALGDLPNGSYFAWGKIAKIPDQAQDARVRAELWQLLEQLTRG